MFRHIYYGQVRLGQWREFFELWQKLDQRLAAEGLARPQLWAPTVGTLNSFMLVSEFETLEAFHANQQSFYADPDAMSIWRDLSEHFDSPPEDELWETAFQIA